VFVYVGVCGCGCVRVGGVGMVCVYVCVCVFVCAGGVSRCWRECGYEYLHPRLLATPKQK